MTGHSREAFLALVTKTVSAEARIAVTGISFRFDDVGHKAEDSSTSWAVEGVRARHRALSGDSRDVIDTHTGGPPKHYTQPDFEAA